jgi:hypothetical protein
MIDAVVHPSELRPRALMKTETELSSGSSAGFGCSLLDWGALVSLADQLINQNAKVWN